MTTRRSRLHIRPNIGRVAKETGSDAPAKKQISVVTNKYLPRKEVKENTILNSKTEENNLAEHIDGELRCDNKPPEHFANNKELTENDSTVHNVEECSDVNNAHSCTSVSSNGVNTIIQNTTVMSDNYTALLNTNRKCTVVLNRTIISTSKNIEEKKSCSTNIFSDDRSSVKVTVIKSCNEKEQKCEEREQLPLVEQNLQETGLKRKLNLQPLSNDADEEKNPVRSKESTVQKDSSTDSPDISPLAAEDNVFVKPIAKSSVISSPEKRSSNKTCSSEETSKRRNRFTKKRPERGTMTMMDLIFWNPPNNPMSHERKTDENTNDADVSVLQAVEEEEEVEATPNLKNGLSLEESLLQTETEELPGPRVMIGPNGDITIDEDSLVIRRIDPEKNASKEIVHEVKECTYNSFRKPRPKHYWTDKETAKFYKALSIVGTDFSLMLNLFPKRNRQELKNKFKREERLNRQLVDRAMRDPQQFDLTAFDDDDDDEGSEEETRNGLKRTKSCNNRKKHKRKKRVKDKSSFEEDVISDDDSLILEPINKSSENVGTRKSTRKRKETSKEIPTYSSTQTMKKRQVKPRISKPKKKIEIVPVECEYESVEIQEIPNENLEVVTEDQSVIVCHSPLASEATAYEEVHRSNVHASIREAVEDAKMLDACDELKKNEEKDVNNMKQPDIPMQQLNTRTSTIPNNVLHAINSNQSNLTPGQLVLVAGKTNNNNEQIVHVYVVSQPPCSQESLLAAQQSSLNMEGTSLLHQTKDSSST